MSPLSILFRELRDFTGLRQAELAERLGYEQSYVSALEIGTKGPPTREFVEKLIVALDLDAAWQVRLWDALDASQRKIILPTGASEGVFRLCNELRLQINELHPTQIELMRLALRLPRSLPEFPAARQRTGRRTERQKEA